MNYSSEQDPQADIGRLVRFTGGKYNGFQGEIVKSCAGVAAVVVSYEGKKEELVEDYAHLTDLAEWINSRTDTELALRGVPKL